MTNLVGQWSEMFIAMPGFGGAQPDTIFDILIIYNSFISPLSSDSLMEFVPFQVWSRRRVRFKKSQKWNVRRLLSYVRVCQNHTICPRNIRRYTARKIINKKMLYYARLGLVLPAQGKKPFVNKKDKKEDYKIRRLL